jgi:surface antigen
MKYLTACLLTVILAVSGGCAEYGTKQTVGGLTGAALGGLLGAQFGGGSGKLATTAAGVLLGGLMGSEIGRSMDEVDRMKADRANSIAKVTPLGETITWNNPDTGHHGSVTPSRDGYDANGNYCREFYQTVTIGGKTEDAYGTACRSPDGSWRIVEQ